MLVFEARSCILSILADGPREELDGGPAVSSRVSPPVLPSLFSSSKLIDDGGVVT